MNAAILIPVFNHARSIRSVVDSVTAALAAASESLPILILDDGSTEDISAALAGLPNITLLRHPRNRGKGAALRTGFRHAHAAGHTHVITVDADGQHDAGDVLKLLAAARQNPDDLIIGLRNMDAATVPLASRRGRDASRFWLRVQIGQAIPDTQCGLRAYPLATTLALPARFKRYDYETEVLARLAWAGVRIKSIPIRCIYFPPAERVSHFRPILDTLRGVRVNLFLVARRLAPLPFKRLITTPAEGLPKLGRWWKLSTWTAAVKEALHAGSSNSELAMAFAMGVFVGLTPFYLLQTLLAIYFARRLHLNILAAVIGSQISIPPLMPLWAALSYAVGHLLLRGEWVLSAATANKWTWSFADLGPKIWPFLVGNFLVAATVAALSLIAARAFLYCVRSQRVPAEG